MAAQGLIRLDEGLFQGLTMRLLSATSMTKPPFRDFGVLSAPALAPKARAAQETRFSAAMAAERISGFLDGTFKPRSLGELLRYFSDQLLGLVAQRGENGRTTNHIVDLRTGESVPAVTVSSRLTPRGLAKEFGRSLDSEAEALARRKANSKEHVLANALKGVYAQRFGRERDVPFADWEDVIFSASELFDDRKVREVTAQGNELWVGTVAGRASADPAENLALVRKLRAQGHQLVLPAKTVADAKAGRFVAGMPVLLKEGAVRTHLIHKGLSMDVLSRLYKENLFEHFEKRPKPAAAAKTPEARRASKDDLRKFLRRGDTVVRAEPVVPTIPATSRVPAAPVPEARFAIRHTLQRTEAGMAERLSVVDGTGSPVAMDWRDLKAGRYVKQDAFGIPNGHFVIGADGGYTHEDQEGRPHNTYGHAVVPGAGGAGSPRHALHGEFLGESEFRAATAPAPLRRAASRAPDRREDEEFTGRAAGMRA